MATPTPASGNPRAVMAAIALVVVVGVGLSVLNPLVSLELERRGVSARLSGLTASAAGIGTIVAVAALPALTLRLGLAGVLAASLALSAAITLLFPLVEGLLAVTGLRFVMGAAIGIIFTLSEYWINVAAPPARRGLVMGLYATTLYAGFALGPLLLGAVIGPKGEGTLAYLVTAALMGAGLVPLLIARRAVPRLENHPSTSAWRFVRAAPAATLGALVFGTVETGAVLLLPVHGMRLGLDAQAAAWLLALFTLGNVLFQVPIGLLADRIPRLPLLAVLALASAACLLALATTPGALATAVLLFAAGGISGGIYPVALALLGERFTDADLAAANGAVVALYSAGLIVGPPAVGLAIDVLGGSGLPLALGGVLALYGAGIALGAKKGGAKG